MIWDIWKGFFDKGDVEVAATIGKERPAITVSIRERASGRRAYLQVPPAEAPEFLGELRKLNGSVRMAEALRGVEVHRKPLAPEVKADYDGEGRLVMTPVYQNGERAWSVEEVEAARIRGTEWLWDGVAFRRIGEPAKAIERFFDRGAKLIYEGDEIADLLREEFDKLSKLVAFKASDRVKASRVARPSLSAVKLKVGDGDWYDLDLKFEAGELKVALAEILKLQGRPKYLRKGDVWVELDAVEQAVNELGAEHKVQVDGGVLRIHRNDADGLRRCRRWRVERERIRSLAPAPVPKGLKATLRDYQKAGLDWMWWLRECRMGGILADDMGLGKTIQTIALLMNAYETSAQGPSLVVCPASVVDHWHRKTKEFAPTLMPYVHHGENRLSSVEDFRGMRVVLTTYGLLVRDAPILSGVDWEYVVLDEAHLIKTPRSAAARAAKQLRARHRLALTGTPIENRPVELWSIMDFAMPGYLGSFEGFRAEYEIPILKEADEGALERLRERIEPFKIRRLKGDVLDELPSKTEDKIYCEMTPHQEALYKAVVDKRAAQVIRELSGGEGGTGAIDAFATLTRLKQICNHPALALESGDGTRLTSGKFEVFQELLQNVLDSGQRVVVFSQFVQMLRIMEAWLRERKIGYSILTGSTWDRAAEVRAFHEDPLRKVFLCSLLAGGCGIDLQCASAVIHYDRWWNKSKEDQATDRVHRMGQTRGVTVYKLITRRSVEEKIDALIAAKGVLFDSVIQAESDVCKAITREDLIQLLS